MINFLVRTSEINPLPVVTYAPVSVILAHKKFKSSHDALLSFQIHSGLEDPAWVLPEGCLKEPEGFNAEINMYYACKSIHQN